MTRAGCAPHYKLTAKTTNGQIRPRPQGRVVTIAIVGRAHGPTTPGGLGPSHRWTQLSPTSYRRPAQTNHPLALTSDGVHFTLGASCCCALASETSPIPAEYGRHGFLPCNPGRDSSVAPCGPRRRRGQAPTLQSTCASRPLVLDAHGATGRSPLQGANSPQE